MTAKVKCTQLLANLHLQEGVLSPDDTEYQNCQNSYWSSTSKLQPGCIVRPRTADEVSSIIKILVEAEQQFAIRSGGHMPGRGEGFGSNNIKDGVQIDLCFLNWVRLDQETSTVDIGPGARWQDVYTLLERHALMVAGGRNGKVGVGGLLLGGGLTFFSGRRGFACDDVLAYDIVLSDGRILTADVENNEDLFHVLKGGAGNFGVVTNFKMKAFKNETVWGGLRMLSPGHTDATVQALKDFTSGVSGDPDSNLILLFAKMPGQTEVHTIAGMINVAGVDSPSYQQFQAIPAEMDTSKMTSVRELVTAYDPAPPGWYNYFRTICIKNDTRIVQKAVDLHANVVADLGNIIADSKFLTECLFQPLPKQLGDQRGNMMGLSQRSTDGLLFVAIILTESAEQGELAHARLSGWVDAVSVFANDRDGLLPWIYMNYAGQDQDPLGSYGREGIRQMREAAVKYDSGEVFQKLSPGGFKVSRVPK